jgi:hypothetical protein
MIQQDNEREQLINKLTLLDVSLHRKSGLSDAERKYKKEPLGFRSQLYKIYSNLSTEDVQQILKIKH